MTEDTIAAIITAPGASSVGIIRLSGPDAIDIGAKIYGGKTCGKWRVIPSTMDEYWILLTKR